MYQDYKDVLSAFQSHGVEYLVVGGFAVIYHSQPRFTKDRDLFIKAAPANARAIYAALSDFGAPFKVFTRTTSPTAATSFALGANRKASISLTGGPPSSLGGKSPARRGQPHGSAGPGIPASSEETVSASDHRRTL